MQRAGVYVHFPWCLKKCPYCDFVSYAKKRDEIDHVGYREAVVRELNARAPLLSGEVESLFFGGGTPSLWDARELSRVRSAVEQTLPVVENFEVTVECNPTSLDRDHAKRLLDGGVNRLSIGVQALREDELKFLGRLHDAGGALSAIAAARAAGFGRVSADLIFGLPEQTPEEAVRQAVALADVGLTHLSCYQLTIESGTLFGELARVGRLPLAEDGRVAEAFLAIDEVLTTRGFRHYEISNYALPGEESCHNLGYWRGHEYLGLGAAAVGRLQLVGGAASIRYRNETDPLRYMEKTCKMHVGVLGREDTLATFHEVVDGPTLLRERIMLGLRTEEGLDLEEAARQCGVTAWTEERTRAVVRLVERGRLVRDGHRLRIAKRAWLFADDTSARLF